MKAVTIPGTETLYKLEKKGIEKAQSMLADAFCDDPYIASLFEDQPIEAQKARLLQRFSLECALKHGLVYASSENMEGIIIFFTPDKLFISDWEYLKLGVLSLNKKIHKNIVRLMGIYGKNTTRLHHLHAPFPHWYLFEIGVDPAHRGKHITTQLLSPFLDYFDSRQMPCYLETHNEKNLSLYEHYGFRVLCKDSLPGTDKPQWCLLRDPQLELAQLK